LCRLYKAGFSRSLPAQHRSASKIARREKGIWQRRFWEHRIRDEHDLQRHVDYIHFNPVKHGLVEHVRDWQYSSFHRCVRQGVLVPDWGGDVMIDADVGEPW
jgi:putative transposase